MKPDHIQLNPFDAIKAVNLTDDQIYEMYVEAKRITRLASPISSTPLLLTGGKGSGRTHLLRYWSYPVQLCGSGNNHLQAIRKRDYIGLYVLLGGINAGRLVSDQIPDALSSTLFGVHLDLAVGASLCRVLSMLEIENLVSDLEVRGFVDQLSVVMGIESVPRPSISDLQRELSILRQALDRDVNAAIDEQRAPRVMVEFRPGELFLRLPEFVSTHFQVLKDVRLSYLLDEFENIAIPHQRHIHSLMREKPPTASLVIGSRSYGVRTYETLSAGERNVEGSEYVEVKLDSEMRDRGERSFYQYCSEIALKRFRAAGMEINDPTKCFETGQREEEEFLASLAGERRSPAMARLLRRLSLLEDLDASDLRAIEARLSDRNDRLMEKVAILAFYKDSARWYPSVETAERVARQIGGHRTGETNRITRMIGHFRSDLVAQLYRDHRRKQELAGFGILVRLADGNPRNFMNLMRLIFKWAEFMNCSPPEITPLPTSVQNRAIREASDWFYRDGEVVGPHSNQVRVAIDRLGELLEKLRYADKIVESSLSAVGFNISELDDSTADVVKEAEAWSLLVQRPYRRDRNRSRQRYTLQINRMLAPRWNLPLSRRGILELNPMEVTAIFGTRDPEAFERVLHWRVERIQGSRRIPIYERIDLPEQSDQKRLF